MVESIERGNTKEAATKEGTIALPRGGTLTLRTNRVGTISIATIRGEGGETTVFTPNSLPRRE